MEIRVDGPGRRAAQRRGHHAHARQRLRARGRLLPHRGLITGTDDLAEVRYCPRLDAEQDYNVVTVAPARPVRPRRSQRNFVATSQLRDLRQGDARPDRGRTARRSRRAGRRRDDVSACPTPLRARADRLRRDRRSPRGRPVHARGRLVGVREDVGRHNAVDKLVGTPLLGRHCRCRDRPDGVGTAQLRDRPEGRGRRHPDRLRGLGPVEPRGRRGRAPSGMTLVGFLRGERVNIYTRADRIAPRRRLRPARVPA